MAELMDHVRVLADQIGPRPVSTEEEHQTSLYVAQELTDSGFEVNVDEFATPTGTRWAYALAFVAVALGTVISGIGVFVPGIALSMFVVGIVLVAAGVFVYYTELNHNPFLSKLRAGGVSQNVVAKHVPASVARDTRSRKVVVVAHVDTVRAQPEAMPQLVQHAPLLSLPRSSSSARCRCRGPMPSTSCCGSSRSSAACMRSLPLAASSPTASCPTSRVPTTTLLPSRSC